MRSCFVVLLVLGIPLQGWAQQTGQGTTPGIPTAAMSPNGIPPALAQDPRYQAAYQQWQAKVQSEARQWGGSAPSGPQPSIGAGNPTLELPSAPCTTALSEDDLAAGRKAYCGYISRYTYFKTNDANGHIAQLMQERHITEECAKAAFEQGGRYYMGDVHHMMADCYNIHMP